MTPFYGLTLNKGEFILLGKNKTSGFKKEILEIINEFKIRSQFTDNKKTLERVVLAIPYTFTEIFSCQEESIEENEDKSFYQK